MTHAVEDLLYRSLTDDGTATGDSEMAVDGTTPVEYYIQPGSGEKFVITRIIIGYEDNGTWTEVKFGSLAALTNGITVKVIGGDTDVVLDLTNGDPIKDNATWSHHCYDADIRSVGGGNSFMAARWSFFKDSQDGIVLSGHRKERLVVTVADNIAGLIHFAVKVRGYKI